MFLFQYVFIWVQRILCCFHPDDGADILLSFALVPRRWRYASEITACFCLSVIAAPCYLRGLRAGSAFPPECFLTVRLVFWRFLLPSPSAQMFWIYALGGAMLGGSMVGRGRGGKADPQMTHDMALLFMASHVSEGPPGEPLISHTHTGIQIAIVKQHGEIK